LKLITPIFSFCQSGVISRAESFSSICSNEITVYHIQDIAEEEKGQLEAKLGGEKTKSPTSPPSPLPGQVRLT